MSNEFKVGDVVQMKSGGPQMTVVECNDSGYVVCEWFSRKSQNMERREFVSASLIKYVRPRPITIR